LYLPSDYGGNKLVLYFHGNAEDVGLAFEMLTLFSDTMRMHVLAVEYPGYGLYKDVGPDELMMKEDCETIYDYLTQVCGVKESDVILWGRSMGSGPCSYLASMKQCNSGLMMSPYMSIKEVSRDILGWASFISSIVVERFNNIDYTK
jgi:abhydrolase domain-containing protein 17